MLKTMLSLILEIQVLFWALALIGYAQFRAFHFLKTEFLSMIDFAQTVWPHLRTLVQRIAKYVRKKSKRKTL